MAKEPPSASVRLAFAEQLWKEAGGIIVSMELPPSGVIGMACLESTYGTSAHFKSHGVIFGITKPRYWRLPMCEVQGTEWVLLPTQAVKDGPVIPDRFCIADSLKTGMLQFRSFIENHPLLNTPEGKQRIKAVKSDPAGFLRIMAVTCMFGAGNGTEYPKTVMKIIEQESLRRFDGKAWNP